MITMDELSVSQYEKAIIHLIPRRKYALRKLYDCPNSSATAKQLAAIIHSSNPSPITASGCIGKIGKSIARSLDITPSLHKDGRPAYFRLVSQYYSKLTGWTINDNLKTA
jgi:hypothetical protein